MILLVIFLIALLFAADVAALQRLSVEGYFKSFVVAYDQANYRNDGAPSGQSVLWSNNNRARLNASLFVADWLDFDLSYDLSLRLQDTELFEPNQFVVFTQQSVYRVDDLDPFIYPDNASAANQTALLQNLDRLLVTFSSSHFDFYLGRQAIAWGSAHAVSPTDVVAPFLYNEIDTEDRIGVDAARLRIPAGPLGEIDAGFVAGENVAWRHSAVFLRGKFYVARTDFAVLLAGFRENAMLGIDLTRAVGGAGVWIESGYVFVNGLKHRSRSDEKNDYVRGSAGIDYNFPLGVYTFIEFHYNEAGTKTPDEYAARVSTVPYAEGGVYLLGRHYLVPGASFQATPLITVFGEVLFNISDSSLLLAPTLEYNLSEDLYLSVGAYVGFGDGPESDQDNLATPVYRSEFGSYPDIYFLSLRFFF